MIAGLRDLYDFKIECFTPLSKMSTMTSVFWQQSEASGPTAAHKRNQSCVVALTSVLYMCLWRTKASHKCSLEDIWSWVIKLLNTDEEKDFKFYPTFYSDPMKKT